MKVKDLESLFVADDIYHRKTLHDIISELAEMKQTPTIEQAIYYLQQLERILLITKTIKLSKHKSEIQRFKDGTKVRYTNQTTNYRLQSCVGQVGIVLSSYRHRDEYLHDVKFEDGEEIRAIGRFLEEVKA